MTDLDSWLEKVYRAGGDRRTLDELYNEWALEYDQQLWASGNPFIAIQAGFVGRFVNDFDAVILDAGCGTGNMTQILFQMGYNAIEGLDPSAGMLEVARQKHVYRKLHQLCLGSSVELPGESFDAIVASGVLTHGHAPPEALDGMLGLAKTGAPLIFSLSKIAHDEQGFGDKLSQLEESGALVQIGKSRLFRTYPFSNQAAHLQHWVCAYRKT